MKTLTFDQVSKNIIAAREKTADNYRKQLAYLYRIFDYYGWCDLIVTHLSVRVPNEEALFIIPFGLSFDEITPDNLVKVDFEGNVLESPCGFQINKNGTTAHRAIYKTNPEVNCILHTHSHYGVAIANLSSDLMLLDQIAMMFHNKVGYHEFKTLFINDNEQEDLLSDMQGKQAVILKNHGLLSTGKTIQEAFWFHYYLETTCKIQVLTMSAGTKINFPSENIVEHTAGKYEKWRNTNDHIAVSDSELLFDAAKRKVKYLFG
jgi:ribulose-5-phosphate 4-epimerase/fuculose-1-phosphate aldolase